MHTIRRRRYNSSNSNNGNSSNNSNGNSNRNSEILTKGLRNDTDERAALRQAVEVAAGSGAAWEMTTVDLSSTVVEVASVQ